MRFVTMIIDVLVIVRGVVGDLKIQHHNRKLLQDMRENGLPENLYTYIHNVEMSPELKLIAQLVADQENAERKVRELRSSYKS